MQSRASDVVSFGDAYLSVSLFWTPVYSISGYEVMTVMTLTTVWHLALGTRAFEWQRPQQLLPFTTAVRALLLPSPSPHQWFFSSISSLLPLSTALLVSLRLFSLRPFPLPHNLSLRLLSLALPFLLVSLNHSPRISFSSCSCSYVSSLFLPPLLASGPSLPLGSLSILRAIDRIPERNDEAKMYVYAFACAPFTVATAVALPLQLRSCILDSAAPEKS